MVTGGDTSAREDAEPGLCTWCEAPIGVDGRCADCGRQQTRICRCGQELRPNEDPCPGCGAKWQGLVKVRRRKRRQGAKLSELIGYTAAGIFLALLVAALFNSLIAGLAFKSSETGQLPESPSERLALAWHTVVEGIGDKTAATVDRLGGVAPFVLVGLLGGLLGLLHYLRRTGGLPLRRSAERDEPEQRRRRRD